MCGILGGWWSETPKDVETLLNSALEKLSHRGPNDKGVEFFASNNGKVALGHTRLSIIDLSSGGHQPKFSHSGRYAIIFNGEIYNYKELRTELKNLGEKFSSDSDTEVLLSAWEKWGADSLRRFEGMFAFVVFDREENKLTCVRDAFGIKPFFYEKNADDFVFASEISSLLALKKGKAKVNWQRSYDYLVHGDYDSTVETFIDGVYHLPAGHYIEVDLKTRTKALPVKWWNPDFSKRSSLSFSQATEAIREQFLKNIRLHLRSDVPLGAALSGGIDSSSVVCAMRHVEPDVEINSFSYIASDPRMSEEVYVDRINKYANAKEHKIQASAADLAADLDPMIRAQGEPFGSTSIYAQYRVFELAKKNGITVTLDGQGADEIFAGYNGYPGFRLKSLLEQNEFNEARKFAANWSQWPARSYKEAWMHLGKIVLPAGTYGYARKILGRDPKPSWLKNSLLEDAGVRLTETRRPLNDDYAKIRVIEELEYNLTRKGIPALLRHGDRNSMRFSIESRVPFLTLEMAELALSLPEEYLISNGGETKHVFRAAMRGIVPDDVLDRKDKVGFATPEQQWLLEIADTAREWIKGCEQIDFIDRDELLKHFDAVMNKQIPFSWQVWRWINYVRWFQTMGVQC